MNLDDLAKKLCVGEHSSLSLEFNSHKSSYQTLAQAVEDNFNEWYGDEDFVSPEEKQRAIDTNTLWSLQWYPRSPVGFCLLHASSLDALLKAAAEQD
jgi:hypothetical protein